MKLFASFICSIWIGGTLGEETCDLDSGNTINAPEWVCRHLNNAKTNDDNKGNFKIPDEIKDTSCALIDELDNGDVYCWDNNKAGSICIAVCKTGWALSEDKDENGGDLYARKRRCKAKRSWAKPNNKGKEVRWVPTKRGFKCERTYTESPCNTDNGGCSHNCLDRGDGVPHCSCHCGYDLDADGKTCVRGDACPFDVTFWLDGSSNSCDDEQFKSLQSTNVGKIMSHFRTEVNDHDAKLAALFYSNANIDGVFERIDENEKNLDELVLDVQGMYDDDNTDLACNEPKIDTLFRGDGIGSRGSEYTSVHIITLADEVSDSVAHLIGNRPEADSVVVLTQDGKAHRYYKQADALLSGTEQADCPNCLSLDTGINAADIEALVSQNGCYDRVFASDIQCTEFTMNVGVPRCALQGLELSDIILNSGIDGSCNVAKVDNGTHFRWEIPFNDCGTTKVVDGQTATYTNALKTKINENSLVFPIMPDFNIPLECEVHSDINYFFTGDWHPELTKFKAHLSKTTIMSGDLALYLDRFFTEEYNGEESLDTSIKLYVESNEQNAPPNTRLIFDTCTTSPNEIVDMETTGDHWELIKDGCILDETVEILPRGADDKLRFSFESFKFTNSDAKVHMQCLFKTCNNDDAECTELSLCDSGRRRRRASPIISL